MSKKALIIVESPTKIKTLKKFLGSEYIFASSLGHVRDLPQKGFGIDVEHDFEPQYEILAGKKEIISKLKKAAKECDTVYLSPDPDREGEAIAWHIAALLPPKTKIKRAAFHSITKAAVEEALANPEEIDVALVNAQQARRLLDRIVGYKISPILARKVQPGTSAGRVQSVALKLVVDREKEILKFNPVEYWNLGAILQNGEPSKAFPARVFTIDGKKWEKELVPGKEVALIPDQETADKIAARLKKATYTVAKVERKEKKRHPEPPFITSTLQQEASRHHRYSSSRTMSIAQSLYEGVDLDSEGAEGLITYMRTDSVRVAPEAIGAARDFIATTYGKPYLPSSPRMYKGKKAAQDAHEAIRPANLARTPESVRKYLTRDQFALYELIWKRFIASQMNPAIYDTVSADITTDQNLSLRATGSTMKFNGYLTLYEEKQDEEKEKEEPTLPHLTDNMPLNLVKVTSEQSFTKPPPRFTEASLVKELEKSGIGRPSTYATIMNKIQSRDYTVKENLRLKPTELGFVIAQFLEDNFQQIMNISFTSEMEDTLELIAANKKEWKEVIREFWKGFIPTVEAAEKEAYVPKLITDIECPKCHEGKLQKIWAKSRYFYGCERYPDCDFAASKEELFFNKEEYAPDFNWDQKCPKCGDPTKLRHGRYGPFLGCVRYPECKGIINIPKKGEAPLPSSEYLPSCPAIGCDGQLVARRSRFGKTFFSCSNYPDCDVIVNEISQIEKKYANHPKTPYQTKKKGAGGGPRGKLKPSPTLASIIGEESITRGEATKKLWDYIKKHNLQNPENKREIVPDEKLAAFFGGSSAVSMFKLAGFLSQHLS
ncbi:MAG: DNA topoisomerase 1 [Chlamydiae bacterium]|nr:DNA topoisomerase 1 [Chlamydiota bacterium]